MGQKNACMLQLDMKPKPAFAALATAYRQRQHHRYHKMATEFIFLKVAVRILGPTTIWSGILSQLLLTIVQSLSRDSALDMSAYKAASVSAAVPSCQPPTSTSQVQSHVRSHKSHDISESDRSRILPMYVSYLWPVKHKWQ